MTYVLQCKLLHIVQEPFTKNRTHQTYRWKDCAMCADRGPLDDFIAQQKQPKDWRIDERPFEAREAQEQSNDGD